ncbi:MAG: hypothetical protein ACPLRS_02795 [Hydrogenobacter sp.]
MKKKNTDLLRISLQVSFSDEVAMFLLLSGKSKRVLFDGLLKLFFNNLSEEEWKILLKLDLQRDEGARELIIQKLKSLEERFLRESENKKP